MFKQGVVENHRKKFSPSSTTKLISCFFLFVVFASRYLVYLIWCMFVRLIIISELREKLVFAHTRQTHTTKDEDLENNDCDSHSISPSFCMHKFKKKKISLVACFFFSRHHFIRFPYKIGKKWAGFQASSNPSWIKKGNRWFIAIAYWSRNKNRKTNIFFAVHLPPIVYIHSNQASSLGIMFVHINWKLFSFSLALSDSIHELNCVTHRIRRKNQKAFIFTMEKTERFCW